MQEVYLTQTEAAARAGVSRETVRNWIDHGVLATVRLRWSRRRFVSSMDLQRLIQERNAHKARTVLSSLSHRSSADVSKA